MEAKMKYMLRILIIVALNLVVISLSLNVGAVTTTAETTEAVEALSKLGSRGSEVRQIQQRLKNWGYYTGSVDGVYGTRTASAVKKFQKKQNLRADGIAGPATLYAIGISSGSSSSGGSSGGGGSNSDYQLLGRIISAEARGEPYSGQVAVGAVVLNRVKHPSFPDTLSGVVYQSGAFTAITDGQFNEPVAASALKAAKEALAGSDPSGGAVYYFNPSKTSNAWMHSRPVIKRIGSHLFCN